MQEQDKIDFVIPWVDGNDPEWQMEKQQYVEEAERRMNDSSLFLKWRNNPMRFRDWDILQYWFRGVEKFAPWVRKIHFVTWGHLPPWLNTAHPKLNIVNHKDYIPEKYLPTFQANAIEDNLHRISGLAEQFVYFNDDMFIIRSTKPDDFFRKGLPRDCAILNLPIPERNVVSLPIYSGEVLNAHFKKNEVIKKHWRKWFNPRYSTQLIKTIVLMPWKRFGCLVQPHLPASFLKSTFETVWEQEYAALDRTCSEKFGGRDELNQYVFSDWQRAIGAFYPRTPHFGKNYFLGDLPTLVDRSQYDEIISSIAHQKYKMICINDGYMTNEEFEMRKTGLQQAFESILPEKSAFEIDLSGTLGGGRWHRIKIFPDNLSCQWTAAMLPKWGKAA